MMGFSVTGAYAAGNDEPYILQFDSEESRDAWIETLDEESYTVHDSITGVSLHLSEEEVAGLESGVPGLSEVSQDMMVSIGITPADKWGFETVNHTRRGAMDGDGSGVAISVIDTGIERWHPNLSYVRGTCAITMTGGCQNGYQDDNGHGTHVAGIINAQGRDDLTGIAPGADLYVVKAMNENGDGRISDVITGIEWSITQNVDIINLSITTEFSHSMLNESIEYATARGITLVGAAGNIHEPQRPVMYPAKHPDVIAVSSVNADRMPSLFSAFGPEILLSAPGEGILSTDLLSRNFHGRQGYSVKSGTSMASPFVAGIFALYQERYPHLNRRDLIDVVTANADQPGNTSARNEAFGFGIVQVPVSRGNEEGTVIPLTQEEDGALKLDLSILEGERFTLFRNGIVIAEGLSGPVFRDYVPGGEHVYEVFLEEDQTLRFTGASPLFSREGKRFNDVKPLSWYHRDVYFLNSAGISEGFSDGSFRPYVNITRAEAVTMIVRALGLDVQGGDAPAPFSDVSTESFAFEAIRAAEAAGIIGGYGDGTFRPGANISRGEVAIMLANAWFSDYEPAMTASFAFSDIHPNESAYRSINTIFEQEITRGFPDGTFRSDQPVQRNQFARFLYASPRTR